MMQRNTQPAVTPSAPEQSCDSQLHVTPATAITRYTCVFPGERIAVVHVIGARSQDEAREACRAAWHGCQYEVQDRDQSNGHAEPFYLWLDNQARTGEKRMKSLRTQLIEEYEAVKHLDVDAYTPRQYAGYVLHHSIPRINPLTLTQFPLSGQAGVWMAKALEEERLRKAQPEEARPEVNDHLNKTPLRSRLLMHWCYARESTPRANLLQHLLTVYAELGEGNEGLFYTYLKEAKTALDSLLQDIEQGRQDHATS
jgi:hypothetical protein